MIDFGSDYIDKLNSTYKGGKFLKTIVLTENPVGPVIKRWVDHEEQITFQGNTYDPLHQRWENIKTSQGMPTEGATISISNFGGFAIRYLKTVDITGNEVLIQLLHLDLLNSTTNHWRRKYKVLAAQVDRQVATFTIGRQLGRNKEPRKVYLQNEFPGLDSDVQRIF